MTLYPVESSMIAAAGYDADGQLLVVLFNSGQAYEYYQVPSKVYQELMSAESKGSYLNTMVRDVYPYAPFRGWHSHRA